MFGRAALLTGLWIASGAVSAAAGPVQPALQSDQINRIPVGETIRGGLAATDSRLSDGRYIDCYTFRPPRGQAVRIDMVSSSFDSYLVVLDGKCGDNRDIIDADDDGGDWPNARIVRTFTQDVVQVVATSAVSGQTGAYGLFVELEGGAPASQASSPGRRIAPGQTRRDMLRPTDPQLPDQTFYHCYDFAPPRERMTTIALSSTTFDAFLFVAEGTCSFMGDEIVMDDDSGGDRNARISTRFAQPNVAIMVNTIGSIRTGNYSLSVR